MKLRINILLLSLLLTGSIATGQIEKYNYQRPLENVDGVWHSIPLQDDIFSKISPRFSDIRIYGITPQSDTVEVPFIVNVKQGHRTQKTIDFKLINQTKNDGGYYFTFEIPDNKEINQLKLEFKEANFDWTASLEGSHDQQEWFVVTDKQRIISIRNDHTDYSFTRLNFPSVNYRFLRLRIAPDGPAPTLLSAKITEEQFTKGSYKSYSIAEIDISQQGRHTIADLKLTQAVPVSFLSVSVKDTIDYYRQITIQYLADSSETSAGTQYHYNTITSGTLSSLESNEFGFSTVIAKNFKISIDNRDNVPLKISSFELKGYEHELVARFTEPARYVLVYGNPNARQPSYDIVNFKNKIPASPPSVAVGPETSVTKPQSASVRPLFENQWWLWVVMGAIILLLGYFSLQMLRKTPREEAPD